MRRLVVRIAITLLAAATALPVVARAFDDAFATPPPRMVEMLRRQHHPHDWLFVTTPTARHEVRVRDLSLLGLEQPRGRHGENLPPAIPWSEVARIEKRESSFRAGQIMGAAVGSLAAFHAGAALNQSQRRTDVYAGWTAIPVGVLVGGWAGGRLGDRSWSASELYSAQASRELAPPPGAASEVSGKVSASEVLRVRGSFGEFVGRVTTVDANGLAGLEPDSSMDPGGATPAEPLKWAAITAIDRRGKSSGHYAKIGAVVGGVVVGAFGAAVTAAVSGLSGSGADAGDVIGGFVIGGGVGALAGAGLGALIGSGNSRWHSVYPR